MESVAIPTLCRFLEAVAVHPTAGKEQVTAYAGSSPRTARKALHALKVLDLISATENGTFTTHVPTLRSGDPEETYREVIRAALVRHRAFEVFAAGIIAGEKEHEALRKTVALLGNDPGLEVMVKWGVDLALLERDGASMRLTAEVKPAGASELGLLSREDVSSEARARLYVSGRLDSATTAFVDEIILTGLVKALRKIASDPGESLKDSGNAVEDFLREVARDKGLEKKAAKQNGISQLGNMLHSEGIIHPHHMNMLQGQGALRNTQGHSKDKRTLDPWEAGRHAAFWGLTGALVLIRTIFLYVYEGRQTL